MATDASYVDLYKNIRDDLPLRNLFLNNWYPPNKLLVEGPAKFKEKQLQWIPIQTTYYENEEDTSQAIRMLSVHTYSIDNCKKIYNALRNRSLESRSNFMFNKKGHIGIGAEGGYPIHWIPNPIIPSSENPSLSWPYLEENSTIASFNKNTTSIDGTSDLDSFYAYNTKILFSKGYKWILYAIPGYTYDTTTKEIRIDQEISEDNPPVYVLLYNPIHRKRFSNVYKKIQELQPHTVDQKDKREVAQTVNVFGALPPTSTINPASINSTLRKYCNAFIVKGNEIYSGARSDLHSYGDPSCAIMDTGPDRQKDLTKLYLGTDHPYYGGTGGWAVDDPRSEFESYYVLDQETYSKIAVLTGLNLTKNSWKYKYFESYNEGRKYSYPFVKLAKGPSKSVGGINGNLFRSLGGSQLKPIYCPGGDKYTGFQSPAAQYFIAQGIMSTTQDEKPSYLKYFFNDEIINHQIAHTQISDPLLFAGLLSCKQGPVDIRICDVSVQGQGPTFVGKIDQTCVFPDMNMSNINSATQNSETVQHEFGPNNNQSGDGTAQGSTYTTDLTDNFINKVLGTGPPVEIPKKINTDIKVSILYESMTLTEAFKRHVALQAALATDLGLNINQVVFSPDDRSSKGFIMKFTIKLGEYKDDEKTKEIVEAFKKLHEDKGQERDGPVYSRGIDSNLHFFRIALVRGAEDKDIEVLSILVSNNSKGRSDGNSSNFIIYLLIIIVLIIVLLGFYIGYNKINIFN